MNYVKSSSTSFSEFKNCKAMRNIPCNSLVFVSAFALTISKVIPSMELLEIFI